MSAIASLQPIACTEPLDKPLSSDDVLAFALSVIRGRVFGPRSTEVKFVKASLQKTGFEIRPALKDVGSLATLSVNHVGRVLRP